MSEDGDGSDITERLLHRDSSAHMDGSANWVMDAHPDDPTKPGKVVVHVPWQADALLREAADAIEALTRDAAGWCASFYDVNNTLIALLEGDR
jgi:hypothetical protein